MELDFKDPNPLVATVAHLFVAEGRAKEVAALAHAVPEIIQINYDSWGDNSCYFNLILQVPHFLFAQLEAELEDLQKAITEKMELVLRAYPNDILRQVIVTPLLTADEG